MKLNELKVLVEQVEDNLDSKVFVTLFIFNRNNRDLHLAITDHLRKCCRKGRVWKSKEFLTALKNASYGFDQALAHSPGGKDGIFVLTRDYIPRNEMMRKLFDRFLDRENSEAKQIAAALESKIEDLIPVRLVSHHMRLLGVIVQKEEHDILVLIDYDDTK